DEARLKSESQFRLVWNISSDGMRLCDPDGTVLMVNDAYCRMFEKSKAEVEAKPLSIIHGAESQEMILRKHREEMAAKSFLPHLDKEIALWNGRKLWLEQSNSMMALPGEPCLLLSIFRDISERKRAEA